MTPTDPIPMPVTFGDVWTILDDFDEALAELKRSLDELKEARP